MFQDGCTSKVQIHAMQPNKKSCFIIFKSNSACFVIWYLLRNTKSDEYGFLWHLLLQKTRIIYPYRDSNDC